MCLAVSALSRLFSRSFIFYVPRRAASVPASAVAAPVTAVAAESDKERAVPAPSSVPTQRPTISGEEGGELFFYRKKDLSLDSNDIAMVSIFQTDIPVSPQFEWNADGEEILDQVPLLVRQVGAVRFSHGVPALGKSLVSYP